MPDEVRDEPTRLALLMATAAMFYQASGRFTPEEWALVGPPVLRVMTAAAAVGVDPPVYLDATPVPDHLLRAVGTAMRVREVGECAECGRRVVVIGD